jgi:excisionase family DNA binding protein
MAEIGLLTLAEASSLLRLKVSTLRSWLLKKRIPYVKLGGRVFLRRSDCDALIAASLVPAFPAADREERHV